MLKGNRMSEEPDQNKQSVRLTERDLEVIRWINSHRLATVEQVTRKIGLSVFTVKKRLSELKSCDYLIYEKLFHEKPGVYRAGAKGVAITGDSLPAARLTLGSYEHDLQLVDLAVSLEHKTGAHWQTDRQLRHEKGLKGVGTPGHIPDGILIFPDGDRVAVELELSPKGAGRLDKILREYTLRLYKEVWYFVSSDYLAARIQTSALPLLKVFSWPDMVEYQGIAKRKAMKMLLEPTAMDIERKTVRDFFTFERRQAGIDRNQGEEQKETMEFFRRKNSLRGHE
jgi:DNA-binding CsgD family transcriptional regulator